MADWTQIADATFDPDRPILGSTHLAIVRNFEALAEGAAGAPRVEAAGRANEFYGRVEISGTTAVGWLNLDTRTIAALHFSVSNSGFSLRAAQIRASANNGATWTAWFSLASLPPDAFRSETRILNLSSGDDDLDFGISEINAIQLRGSASDISGSAVLYALMRA